MGAIHINQCFNQFLTDNNLVSAMLYHFAWNLFIHVFAINPNDNGGNSLPYIILVILEIVIGLLLLGAVKQKELISKSIETEAVK